MCPQFGNTAYISEVNRARKVKSDAQEQELGPRAEIFSRVAGVDGVLTPIFRNFRNYPKRVELEVGLI